uniref:Uncharacterized protein n=1 Tax=Arundo donax TaxID=35708 RepID=A0A0A9HWR7_ARUDO
MLSTELQTETSPSKPNLTK